MSTDAHDDAPGDTPPAPLPTPAEVIGFWREAGRRRWFSKDDDFDARFRERFLAAHEAAARGALDDWAATADGGLALLILLDQFPRNAFRGSPRIWATDPQALAIARAMVDTGRDLEVEPALRLFVYLPFSHSESLAEQERAVQLQGRLDGDAQTHALGHREIIRRFGRFPHRNAVLGRRSTPEEQHFLDEGGFAG